MLKDLTQVARVGGNVPELKQNKTSEIVLSWARTNGLEVSDAQLEKFAAYQSRVLTVNRHMNLTAITDEKDFAVKHLIDSLTLLPYIKKGQKVIDVGTGAGFPGLVLRIMREDLRLTLLDSLRKRVVFLRETADMLNFPEVECIHSRAEEWAKAHCEAYDICTARAVASLDKLVGYALHLVKKGGVFLAMKWRDIAEEIEKANPALKKHGGVVEKVALVEIDNNLKHSIVIIRKSK